MRLSWTRLLLSAGISLATVAVAPDAQALAPADSGGDAEASEPGASAGGSASVSLGGGGAEGDASATADGKGKGKRKGKREGKWGVEDQDKKPLFRYIPERNMWEVGLYGGAFFPHVEHDFYHPDTAPQKPLWAAVPEFGVRAAYLPLSFLGVEAEFSAIPAFVRNAQFTFAFLYGFRGHVLLQAPGTRIAPFLLGGYGGMGVFSTSERSVGLGNDLDPLGHLGVGVKVFLNRYIALRLDARQYIGARAAEQSNAVSHYSLTGGITFTLGRKKKTVGDMDKDGFNDNVDVCPMAPGIAPDGCPPRDLDSDGLFDHEDRCPCDPGPAPTGCPQGKDRDGDGFMDEVDKCPDEPGIAPEGCPVRDADNDGFPDEKDTCPTAPETRNGFEDGDGCPDEVPKEIEKVFEGALQGIQFEVNSAKIKPSSATILNEAVDVLNKYPTLRVRVQGHTDDQGDEEYNLKLSRERAAEVKKYLVDKGIDEGRLESEGFGESRPVAEGTSKEARAQNRRTEFVLIQDKPGAAGE